MVSAQMVQVMTDIVRGRDDTEDGQKALGDSNLEGFG